MRILLCFLMILLLSNCSSSIVLTGTSITNIPDAVFQEKSLTHLNINHASIHRLHPQLASLKQLKTLQLENNLLDTLSESAPIWQLNKLVLLNLNKNGCMYLSFKVGQLSLLQSLLLCQNKLKKWPEIQLLDQLRQLHLSSNLLSTIPKELWDLNQLEELYLDNNQINFNDQPLNFSAFKQLKRLSLGNFFDAPIYGGNNRLDQLPASINQLVHLTSIQVNNCQLQTLPAQLDQLKKLQVLSCAYNQLQKIPSSITELSSLQHLNLQHNNIEILPTDLGKLTKLTQLNISNNPIKVLPESLGQLKQLKSLDLSNTGIQELPQSFKNWTALKHIYLDKQQKDIAADILLHLDTCEVHVL